MDSLNSSTSKKLLECLYREGLKEWEGYERALRSFDTVDLVDKYFRQLYNLKDPGINIPLSLYDDVKRVLADFAEEVRKKLEGVDNEG